MQKNNHLSGLNLSLSKTNRNLLEVESATVHLHANRSTLIEYIPKFTRPKSIEIKIVSSRQRSQLIGPTIFFISEKRRIDALIGYIIIFTSGQTVSLARRSSWVTIIAHFYELRRIFTDASQRLEPVINVGCKMLSVPLVFSMSRFRGPAFRCDKIVVIATLVRCIAGLVGLMFAILRILRKARGNGGYSMFRETYLRATTYEWTFLLLAFSRSRTILSLRFPSSCIEY